MPRELSFDDKLSSNGTPAGQRFKNEDVRIFVWLDSSTSVVFFLVGSTKLIGKNPSEKYARQTGNLPQIGVKIKKQLKPPPRKFWRAIHLPLGGCLPCQSYIFFAHLLEFLCEKSSIIASPVYMLYGFVTNVKTTAFALLFGNVLFGIYGICDLLHTLYDDH